MKEKRNGIYGRIKIIKKDEEKETIIDKTERKQITEWCIKPNKPLITLIVNGLNIQIKRQEFLDWMKTHGLALW